MGKFRDSVHDIDEKNIRISKWLVFVIVIFFAFAAGFMLRGNPDFLARIGFSTDSDVTQQNPGLTVSGNTYDSLSARVAEIQGVIAQESLDTYDLDKTTTNVINSFAEGTSDGYLRYYDAAHYQSYIKDTAGKFSGFGILLSEYKGQAYIVDVFDSSEAQAKGVKPGDFITAIDGDRGTDGWTQSAAIKSLTRQEGDSVVLTLRRPKSLDDTDGEEITVTLTCTNQVKDNVTYDLRDDNVGYIKLAQITQNSDKLVRDAIKDLTEQGAQSFVLDLRDNPGGYLTQSLDIASLFIKSGTLVEIQTKEGSTTKTASGSTITDAPLAVLVNTNTAGTSEVLAGALQDAGRATILGTNTLGKGSVQSLKELSFGGAIRFTSAFYKTPKGYDIENRGITPNVVVSKADGDDDNQLTLAIDTIRVQS